MLRYQQQFYFFDENKLGSAVRFMNLRPKSYLERAGNFGLYLETAKEKGPLEVLYLRPLDLSVDKSTQEILDAIRRVGAKRLVIDSLVGFEMGLSTRVSSGLSRIARSNDRSLDWDR